jgi:hypothetical protein
MRPTILESSPCLKHGRRARRLEVSPSAEVASGAIWWALLERLSQLMRECARWRQTEFRSITPDATHFAQTAWSSRQPWVVEYRNGSADEHDQARSEDKHVVHNVLLGYAYDLPGWETLVEWTKVEFERPSD